jgi:hypothetical protein
MAGRAKVAGLNAADAECGLVVVGDGRSDRDDEVAPYSALASPECTAASAGARH